MADTRLWLYIDFTRLALQTQFGTGDSAIPQLLLNARSGIEQCNDAADALGVRPGMNTATAYCLLCETETVHYDALAEQEQLQRLALLLYQACADIRLCPPSGLSLEVGSMLRLYNGLDALTDTLKSRLEHSGFRYRWACGHTAQVAQVLATNDQPLVSHDRQRLVSALDPISITRLGLETKDAARLESMGVHRYADLRQLPRAELGYRFGPTLLQRLQSLETPDTLGHRFEIPPYFDERLELSHEAEHSASLLFPVKRLLTNLEDYLKARQRLADSLYLRLNHRNQAATRLRIQAVQGSRSAQEWLSLINLQLDRLILPEPVLSLQLRARRFRIDPMPTGDLLGTAYPQADADRLLSLLVSRLGHHRVQTLTTTADPRPELATRLTPAVDHSGRPESSRPRFQPVLIPKTHTPVSPQHYQLLSGAERIVMGRWAQPVPYRRDYFRAWHLRQQQVVWLARHDDGHWSLAGFFG
ncbi:Y-family DNA polymerase [Saccharospirillum impatiens]|uniref:Y-family DNA polymerase n=1 Tax=Saccharospirillum impatiens TaxID=169438 RepID=UPI0003F8F658|nr:DNA polymerase Y family protein [Saccharospirillum impatiens]